MLNPVHPDTPHISAVRAWRFAQELATLGHRVVLLTATRGGTPKTTLYAHHDWCTPCVLPCAAARLAPVVHAIRLPLLMRRAGTAVNLLCFGGCAHAWGRAAVTTALRVAPQFSPDVVWATFGRLEAVFAAKRIARALRCRWVLDVKDNCELYVPRGLHSAIAARIRGFACISVNAELTREVTGRWLNTDSTVIYSGVDPSFFARAPSRSTEYFTINLVGGIYFQDLLIAFLAGVSEWLAGLSVERRARVRIAYLGSQGELVRDTARVHAPGTQLDLPGYVAVGEMAQRCQSAAVNVYLHHPGTFHHKLPELLSCGRPVMAFPTEFAESLRLAAGTPGQLLTPATPAAVARELRRISVPFFTYGVLPEYDSASLAQFFSWATQGSRLEKMLLSLTGTTSSAQTLQ